MRFIFAGLLLLQAAPAQSEADKTEAALKKFGDRTYNLTGGLAPMTVTMKTRIEKVGDRKVAVFIHGDVGGTAIETASLEGLLLLSEISSDPKGDVRKEISIRDSQATIIQNGKEQETVAVTKSTVGVSALWRLICMKEQKVGASFRVDLLLYGDRVSKDHEFRCVAKETIEIGGVKHAAFKWDQKGEWTVKMRREVHTFAINHSHWVSPDGYLLRWTAYKGGEVSHDMVLVSK